jgi:hypothetical protein
MFVSRSNRFNPYTLRFNLRDGGDTTIITAPTEIVAAPETAFLRTNLGIVAGEESGIKEKLRERLLVLYSLESLQQTGGYSAEVPLVAVNSPNIVSGKLGNCYLLNRSFNQKLHDPNNLIKLSLYNSFTVGCWFLSTDNNTYAPPIGFGRDSFGALECLGERTINTDIISWYFEWETASYRSVFWDGFVINVWFFVLIEYSKPLGRIALYVNGVLRNVDTTISTTQNLVENTQRGMTLGAYARDLINSSFHFSGLIDESFVLLGNTAQAERDWLWNNGSGNTLA